MLFQSPLKLVKSGVILLSSIVGDILASKIGIFGRLGGDFPIEELTICAIVSIRFNIDGCWG